MDKKIKHLEMIQMTISKFDNNSFLLRGWAVTLVTAAIALNTKQSDKSFFLIAYLPIAVFWIFDGYFVSVKRRYLALYNHVRKLPDKKIDFSMDSKPFKKGKNTWKSGCFAHFPLVFYGTLLFLVIVVSFFY
jgi:hypothetical protein